MKPEQVPDEWAALAGEEIISNLTDRRGIRQAFDNIDADIVAEITEKVGRVAIAAVAPMIAAAEREACAEIVERGRVPTFGCKPRYWPTVQEFGPHLRSNLAAAIRARGDAP